MTSRVKVFSVSAILVVSIAAIVLAERRKRHVRERGRDLALHRVIRRHIAPGLDPRGAGHAEEARVLA